VKRWGQINLNERDPLDADVGWWVDYWRRTHTQGIVLNAGGIIAFYPTEVPFHHRATFLGDRDLFGELSRAARGNGMAVIARTDSNRADSRVYYEHVEWFAHDADGKPFKEGDLFVGCIHGPYYAAHIPAVLREVIERYHPDGFFDNSWKGLSRQDGVCFCPNCVRGFRAATGLDLPRTRDLENATYRRWLQWNVDRRTAVWVENNRLCRELGGPDCLWIGNTSGDLAGQSNTFRDWEALAPLTPMVVLDHQGRGNTRPFWDNGEQGKFIRSILGDDTPMPESMAVFDTGRPRVFRRTARSEPEVRLWWAEGVAGGIRPWWHVLGTVQEDRRMLNVMVPLHEWHAAHERYLFDRTPVANVAIVFSQRNVEWYGRNEQEDRCMAPQRGIASALVRARIPYAMVPDWKLDAESLRRYRLLILPNIGALSDARVEQLRAFVQAGGSLLATGDSTLYDEWGAARPDFALGDVFGVRSIGVMPQERFREGAEDWGYHTYFRLPADRAARHEILRQPPSAAYSAGWDETDLLCFGGRLRVTEPTESTGPHAAQPLLTYVPPFPFRPPEVVWMRQSHTEVPTFYAREHPAGGRVVYAPADVDRLFWRHNHPDHGDLLARAVRWALRDDVPVRVQGPGLVDVHAYVQGGNGTLAIDSSSADRVIVHLVNVTGAGTWRAPMHEHTAVGAQTLRVRAAGRRAASAHLLVSGTDVSVSHDGDWVEVEVPSVLDHEVVVIEWAE
jgi:hypothetical protein